jgi:hypothetical protein
MSEKELKEYYDDRQKVLDDADAKVQKAQAALARWIVEHPGADRCDNLYDDIAFARDSKNRLKAAFA